MKTDNRPIWGFPAELSYLLLFGLLVVSGVAFRIWYETSSRTNDDVWDTVVQIIAGTGQVGLAAATCTAGIAAMSEVIMILAERYKARRFAEGLAEGRAEGLADGVERAIRQTAEEISQGVEVQIDSSQWFSRDVMRVVIIKGESRTEAFEVTIEQALSSRLHPLLKDRIESLD